MKLIVAIFNTQRLEYVTAALRRAKSPGCTVTPAKGFGKDSAAVDWDFSGKLYERVRIELVIDDDAANEIVRVIQKAASTGKSGDGIIFVQEVLSSIRIGFGDSTGMYKISD